MKHAPVQPLIAAILILGAPLVARADDPEPTSTSARGRVVASAAESVDVDADATMTVSPGEGAGVFVQYASGGHWNVFTACDTNLSNRPCRFDLLISADPGVSLSDPQGRQLEPVDVLSLGNDGTIRLQTGTAGRLDGVTFDADPGATIRIDLLLDGAPQPGLFNWISGGEQRQGTPETPVDFTPSSS